MTRIKPLHPGRFKFNRVAAIVIMSVTRSKIRIKRAATIVNLRLLRSGETDEPSLPKALESHVFVSCDDLMSFQWIS